MQRGDSLRIKLDAIRNTNVPLLVVRTLAGVEIEQLTRHVGAADAPRVLILELQLAALRASVA